MSNKKSQTKTQTFLRTISFSTSEKNLIIKARQITHCDMPSLYHDCIMASVMQIVKKGACE